MKKRGDSDPEPVLDPPYGQKDVPDPTEGDPQVVHKVDPDDVRFPDGPDNMRNPDIDNKAPGQPRTFPPPGPPRE